MPAATKRRSKLVDLGLILFGLGVGILFLIYLPVAQEEVRFAIRPRVALAPIDTTFGIVIPKLGANARIIENVDPFNGKEYQRALTRGVAHAKGTNVPGQNGTIFLFSHSSVDFYRAAQFNSIFYLIHKLEKGDTIELYYKGEKYAYEVTEKKRVKANAVEYLSPPTLGQTLTLMTCWPPGTTLERLLVFAQRVDE